MQKINAGARPNVLVLAPTYPPAFKAGGPARTLEALVSAAPSDMNIWVIAPNSDLGEKKKLPVESNRWLEKASNVRVQYVNSRNLVRYGAALTKTRRLKPSIVYINSFSNPHFSLLPYFLSSIGVWPSAKLVVAPRGEMDPKALALKARAKNLIVNMLRLSRISGRFIWQASNEREAKQIIKVWGERSKIIIKEDETSLPELAVTPNLGGSVLKLGYISRIVPNKGLLEAIEATLRISESVQLDIYGPAEDSGYFEKCKKIAENANATCEINFLGSIPHSEVLGKLFGFDAFVFPTEFENFSHSIAEALSMSCPVISPDTTPWTDVLRNGGGFIIESPIVENLSQIIENLARMSPRQRLNLRNNAGNAYNSWRSGNKNKHIFEEILDRERQ